MLGRRMLFNVGYTRITKHVNEMTNAERLSRIADLSRLVCDTKREIYNSHQLRLDVEGRTKRYVNQTFEDDTVDVMIGWMDIVQTMQHLTRTFHHENIDLVFGGTVAACVLAIPPVCPQHLDMNVRSDSLSDEKLTRMMSNWICIGATECSCYVDWDANVSIYEQRRGKGEKKGRGEREGKEGASKKLFTDSIEVEGIRFAPLEHLCTTCNTLEVAKILQSDKQLDMKWIERQLKGRKLRTWKRLVEQYRPG